MNNRGGSGESCYYSILGIHKDASFSEIRSAYRKLALKWHPDRWAKKPSVAEEAKWRFQKIQEAYSVLSDDGKRPLYDAGFLDLLEEDEVRSGEDKKIKTSIRVLFFAVVFRIISPPFSSCLINEDHKSEGMGDFLRELMNMMEQNAGKCKGKGKQAKEEETLEDLQRIFIDMFGGDLAKMMQDDNDDDHPPVKRRARHCGSTARAGF